MSHTHLAVNGISHSYADRRVLTDISFAVNPGDRLGLIGENGTGKSTLLKIIAGSLRPDAGSVAIPGSAGLLEQQLPYPDTATISRVLDDAQQAQVNALDEIERLAALVAQDPENPTLGEAYGDALETAEREDAWSAQARRGEVLSGLGLGGLRLDRAIGELSGGQRLRLSLAALLLGAPHTLLLDEPSNHLDDEAALYLERVLRDWRGIVIVASHDRSLLDAVTTGILDLDALPMPTNVLAHFAEGTVDDSASDGPGSADTTDDTGSAFGARMWGVGYSEARAARRAELIRWRALVEAEAAEYDALRHEIEVGSRLVNRKRESKSESKITRKFYADKDARVTARRARNARVRLDHLERTRTRRPPEPLRFAGFQDLDPATHAGAAESAAASEAESVLSAQNLTVAGRLRETSFSLPAGGRLLINGANGAGKSTLLATLAGHLDPDAGEIWRPVSVGYLPQEVTFENPALSAADAYRSAVGQDTADLLPLEATGLLARRDVGRQVGSLSVGQRRRVALAALVAAPPQVLLLDEPTNHLSLTLVEELEEALQAFAGALVIATHDRWLRSRWGGDTLTLTPAF